MELNKVRYKELNSKQKENYNFHKVAAALAEYGFNSMRLNDDWQGADFISVHVKIDEILKVQLKGRFTISKKYIGKNIHVAFIEDNIIKLYIHVEALKLITKKIRNHIDLTGSYDWPKTPKRFKDIISIL